jgi:hypothetical protein
MYTVEHKQQTNFLTETLQVVSYLNRFFLTQKLEYSISTIEYTREVQGAVSDLIMMLNGTGGWRLAGVALTGPFHLQLRLQFLFRAFLGRRAKVAIYRGVLYNWVFRLVAT